MIAWKIILYSARTRKGLPINDSICTHVGNVVVGTWTYGIRQEQYPNVFGLFLVSFEYWYKKTLNRKSTAHHSCKTCNSCPKSRNGVWSWGACWGYPDQKNEIAQYTSNAITHNMCPKIKKFEDDAPNEYKSSVDESVCKSEGVGWD